VLVFQSLFSLYALPSGPLPTTGCPYLLQKKSNILAHDLGSSRRPKAKTAPMFERDDEWRYERGLHAEGVLEQLVPASLDAGWGRLSDGEKSGVGPGMKRVVAMHADELRRLC